MVEAGRLRLRFAPTPPGKREDTIMTTMKASEVQVYPEATPNPASVRFVLEQRLLPSGTVDIPDASKAARAPLAQRLFEVEGVKGVLIGPNFVTVTASPDTDWTAMMDKVVPVVQAFVASGEPAVTGKGEASKEGASGVEAGIIRVIEEEIRPAVAMDGGDIIFGGYENGVVSLHLRGACSGCPSSLMTLKMGIERRLKEEFPEIESVEAV
jgi:Fe-S cluster biogenesis protein NfuA